MKNKDLERAVYMWFNMKYELYNKLEANNSIYLHDEGQEYADIVIYKKYRNIYFNWDFWKEFSEVFPMELSEFKKIMSKWVEDTFNLEGFTTRKSGSHRSSASAMVKIPNYKQN